MYTKDVLLPSVNGDQNNLDEKGRVKVTRAQISGQAFLGGKINFHDVIEKKDYLGHVVQFSNDGITVYLHVNFSGE